MLLLSLASKARGSEDKLRCVICKAKHPVRLILHPIIFRRLAFKGPSVVFILACQLSSSLLHPTSTIFLPISSRLPRSLAGNPPPVSDRGEDISKSKPYKCSS
ncbi:hypothetical protein ATANTOWER_013821 [Ataeniobius toweri]|uniref:Uncharacterized protein n=1 Tax=Ataeniobius toweri TaxID=208326 RepID=A0ABU7B4R3_9TELE|nr:hypothetical protein [Ataeniobius toweri]